MIFGAIISGVCDVVESVYDNTLGEVIGDTFLGDIVEGTGDVGRHLLELGGDIVDVPFNAGLDIVDNVIGDGDNNFLGDSEKSLKSDFNNLGDDVEKFCNEVDDIFL